MAKVTTTNLIDDLDGSEADVTVSLVVDSQHYTVDLSHANYEEYIAPLVNVGRGSRGKGRGRRGASPKAGTVSVRSATAFSKLSKSDQVAIRRSLKKTRGRVTDIEVSSWKDKRKA